jgi:methionyl-tRNA formyltransferase
VHPGYLPTYRGAMAYFWPLHRGDRHAGVSVHWIDEGIDTGPLLERRRLCVRAHATQQKMLVKSAVAGAYLLRRVARQLIAGQMPTPIRIEPAAGGYFHFPAAADVSAYMARYRFFRLRDLWTLLLKPATR